MPAGIGEMLRDARQDAGVELDEVERTIRIRSRYLAALENEEWSVLPGDAYVRGFLHTYGDYLGLDGAALVDEYDRLGLGGEPEQPVETPFERAGTASGREASPWRRSGTGAAGFEPPGLVGGDRFVKRAVPIMAAVVAALAVLFIVLAVTGGSEKKGGGHKHHGGKSGHSQQASTTTTTTTPTEAAVTLQPTGTVWVCLVDHSGTPLVNGETLTVGDDRGPFKDRDMKVNLGNGEIRIQLNGDQVPIPSAAEPIGFDLTPQGAKPLDPSQRPTCS
jgi:cytoskeleton protein RodZ